MWHCWNRCVTGGGWALKFQKTCAFLFLMVSSHSNRNPNDDSSNQCIISPSAKSRRLSAQPLWDIFITHRSPPRLRQCPGRGYGKKVSAGRWRRLQGNAGWMSHSYYNHRLRAAVVTCSRTAQTQPAKIQT